MGFTEKFSQEVTEVIVSAYDWLGRTASGEEVMELGPETDKLRVRLVFPIEACRTQIGECIDPDAPGVRYVSRGPVACAALRFRCDEGQLPFSDECGCGCRSPE